MALQTVRGERMTNRFIPSNKPHGNPAGLQLDPFKDRSTVILDLMRSADKIPIVRPKVISWVLWLMRSIWGKDKVDPA
ncbi:hypothetical protein E5D57_010419 [Metarhizium anisopliae]|nr:hypothetical protein E5D57_010419 [Metarhizium anisopliae]